MTLEQLVYAVFDPIREKSGGEVDVDCCFCDDGKQRLGINLITGMSHCFHCDYKSGDRDNPVNSRRRTFYNICQATSYKGQFTLDEGEVEELRTKSENKYVKPPEIPKEFEPLWKQVNESIGKKARRYLLDRGVTKEQIKEKKIGFCATGYYSWRIVFPVLYRGVLKGLVGRDFSGTSDAKYLNSKGVKTLYNLPAKSKRHKKVILVEGVFDVLAVERAKIIGWDIVCGLGSNLSVSQIKRLSTYNTVCIWAEPDRGGVAGTIKRANILKQYSKIEVIVPLRDTHIDTDPGNMLAKEIQKRFKHRKVYSSAVAALMRNRITINSPVIQRKKKQWKKPINNEYQF